MIKKSDGFRLGYLCEKPLHELNLFGLMKMELKKNNVIAYLID